MVCSWEPGKFPTRCFLGKDPHTQCSSQSGQLWGPAQGLGAGGGGSPLECIPQERALEDDITQVLGPLGKG